MDTHSPVHILQLDIRVRVQSMLAEIVLLQKKPLITAMHWHIYTHFLSGDWPGVCTWK